MSSSLGLVLSGGGARAAYQAGVIKAIADICQQEKILYPASYYTGLSAGAINTAMLTTTGECHFNDASDRLVDLWSKVTPDHVFINDVYSLSKGGINWLLELSMGGMKKFAPRHSLLETTPLQKLIADNCQFENIQKNILDKKIRGVAVSAIDYFSTSTVSFVQAAEDVPIWSRARRQALRTEITAAHIMASASIPLLFPPVTVENGFFGDGCIKNSFPCSPAIDMGARSLIAIGVRCRQEACFTPEKINTAQPPSIARIVSVLLNAVMMDGLETDYERIQRINMNLAKLSAKEQARVSVRPIDCLWIAPSRNLAQLASQKTEKLPGMVRYLLKGLGSLQEASEISSFLLFDPSYSEQLIEIGYSDGLREKDQIRRLVNSETNAPPNFVADAP